MVLCTTNSLIKYQSFVFTLLNDQRVLFQTIQLSICHLFALSLNVKHWPIDRTLSGTTIPGQSVDLGARAMKWFSIFPKSPRLEPCHSMPSDGLMSYPGQLLVCVGGVLLLCRDDVDIFYSQLGYYTYLSYNSLNVYAAKALKFLA